MQTRRAFLATGAAVLLAACGDAKRPPPPRPRERVDVAVIGGGLAGLVATYRLRKAGIDARLYEGSNRLGEHTSVWQGYMNGAVESGERAAGEIIG